MSEYNRHKFAMEWMHGGGRDPHGRGLDEEIRIGKEDWMERQQMAEGGQAGHSPLAVPQFPSRRVRGGHPLRKVSYATTRSGRAEGGQLVQPGPGRQGYSGDWNPYAKSPKFKKFLKEWKGAKHRMADVVRAYEAVLSTEGKTVGFIELHKSLGKDNPYSEQTFRNIFNRANRKITKNTSAAEVANTKKAKRLQKIITDSIGEAELLGDIQKAGNWKYLDYTGTSKKNVWTLNKSKINQLNQALNKEFMTWGLQENTIDNVFDLAKDNEFIKSLKNYKGGAVDLDSALFKKVFKPGKSGELSYAYMQLGRILRGEIELEGIKKDKALGNKIIKSIFHKTARNSEGPMNTAASHWSRHQLAKDFDNPKATYDSLRRTISDAFKDAGIKNINVDEIFPLRTGQLTIGKGSGAFNNFVQFIDSNINQKAKRQFDGMASTRYQEIIKEMKGKNPDWTRVKKLVGEHENAINIFYKNNPKARGKVKLPKLHYDEKTRKFLKPSQVFDSQYGTGTYKAIPQKIRKGMEKFHTKTGLSLDPGTTMTLEKAATDLKAVAGNKPAQIKLLKRMGYGKHCKASGGRVGFADAGAVTGEIECILDDVKKNKADLNSPIEKVRNTAILKNKKATEIAEQLPKIGKWFRRAFQGTFGTLGLDSPFGWAIEGILEGGIYEYYRRQGHTHEQAFQETFTPGIVAGRPQDVPWYGGAEKLLEKELYQIKGENEFMDVENRPPMQDPEFGQVIGERESVKRYIENEKALAEAEAKYNQLYTGYEIATTGRQGSAEKGEKYKNAMEDTWQEINSLKDQLDLDRDMYEAAVEKQETDRGVRAIEYGEYGTGDTPELAKKREERRHKEFLEYRKGKQRSFYLPKGKLQERVEDPLAETPYTFLETKETLPAFSLEPGMYFPWEDIPRYQGEEGTKRKWQDLRDAGGWDLMDKIGLAGGVANMAEGGIASLLKK